MDAYRLCKGILFLLLAVIGIPGNCAVLTSYVRIAWFKKKLFPAEKIISALAFVNTVMILTRGLPYTLFSLGAEDLFNKVGCQSILYISRVSRAMAIGLTCLLSCFQLITVSPAASRLAQMKNCASKYLVVIIISILFLNLILCYCSVIYAIPKTNTTNMEFTFDLGYCILKFWSEAAYHGYGLILLARDLFFVILMGLASAAILFVLYQHRQHVKQIRSNRFPSEQDIEWKAAKAVVGLASMYVFFFGIENTIFLVTMTGNKVNPVVSDARIFFSICYASVFPIVVIATNSKVRKQLNCEAQENETETYSTSYTI
ncbi:olfactory receptor class A-like protein 1 [Protopterus annectens]|uniref:olfactory receptor class A-like protein 1 n=1 Tax=Protopterus annectens TaxID=7888 RepID=UPI001CFB1917|nr:olfactory receptor class A-like protein 1 [Protopterus annectens]